jgi:hypothetical protein
VTQAELSLRCKIMCPLGAKVLSTDLIFDFQHDAKSPQDSGDLAVSYRFKLSSNPAADSVTRSGPAPPSRDAGRATKSLRARPRRAGRSRCSAHRD